MSAFIILGAKIPLTYYAKLLLLPDFSYSQVSYLFYFPLHRQPMHYLPIFGLIHGRIGLFSLETQVCYQRSSCSLSFWAVLVVYTFNSNHFCTRNMLCATTMATPSLLVELVELTYRFIFMF